MAGQTETQKFHLNISNGNAEDPNAVTSNRNIMSSANQNPSNSTLPRVDSCNDDNSYLLNNDIKPKLHYDTQPAVSKIDADRKTYMNHERLRDSIRSYNNNNAINYQVIKNQIDTAHQTNRAGSITTPIVPLEFLSPQRQVTNSLEDESEYLPTVKYLEPADIPPGVALHFKRTGINQMDPNQGESHNNSTP